MRGQGRRTLLIGLAAGACAALLAGLYFFSQSRTPASAETGAAEQALAEVVRVGDTATARAMIERGVDVNAATVDGTSALHWAVHLGEEETARLLIRRDARVDAL